MASGNAEVTKAVRILIALKGSKEVQQGIKETYETSEQGNEQLRRDAKRSGDDVELFHRKWKHQLLAVGSALGVLWGLAKTSPLAASMISMVGTALGYLATVILMPLLPLVLWLTIKIIELADWFSKLPDPIKIAVAALLGLAAVWALLKGLGLIDLAKKIVFDPAKWLWGKIASFLALWNATMAAGGLAGALAFVAAVAAGLGLAGVVIWAMLKSGIVDALSKLGGEFEKAHPIISDVLKVWLADFAKLGVVGLRAFSLIGSGLAALVSGKWDEFNAMVTDLKSGAIQRDFAEIDKQRGEAVGRLSSRALGRPVEAYVRPENPNPTPLNFDVAKWLGVGSSSAVPGGPGMSPIGTAGAEQIRADARAAGVPEAAIDQVLENMGAKIDQKGQQWNTTLQTNLDATGTTLADKSGAWSPTMAANTGAVGSALVAGASGWAPTVTTATGEVNTALQGAGIDWGRVIIDAIGSGIRGAIKILPGGGILESFFNAGATALPSHATGGRVAQTGLALMHEGDWVRSSFGDTTRTGTGGGVQNSGGSGGGFTLNGDLNIYSQATDAAGIKRDIIRELGSMARRA